MRAVTSATIITLGAALAAFLLGPILWPPSPDLPTPTAAQLPFFILLKVLEVLTFGLGLAFLTLGLPLVRRAAAGLGLSPWPAFLAIGWSLVSWWPHDSLHLANGMDLGGLLLIEYGFHVSLFATAAIVGWYFLAALQSLARTAEPAPRAVPEGTVRPRVSGVG
jgi:hypothetical protein